MYVWIAGGARAEAIVKADALQQLRLLAEEAQHDDDARAVLHDALLEIAPRYLEEIVEANRLAADHGGVWTVWFFPTRTRSNAILRLAFEIHRDDVVPADLSNRVPLTEADRAVVVYRTLDLVYEDPKRDGHGVLRDRRSGEIVARRHRPSVFTGPISDVGVAADRAFDRWMEDDLVLHWSREALIQWLEWNDPNGSYADDRAAAEGFDPLTHEEAVDLVMVVVRETHATPNEMRASSRRR